MIYFIILELEGLSLEEAHLVNKLRVVSLALTELIDFLFKLWNEVLLLVWCTIVWLLK